MTRGYQDDGVNTDALGQYGTDLSELAARLGSPYTILRSGHVIWLDTFESGVSAWHFYVTGGAAVTQDAGQSYSGNYVMKLLGGLAAGSRCLATKRIPIVRIGTFGFEFVVTFVRHTATAFGTVDVSIGYYTGADVIKGEIEISPDSGMVRIRTMVGGIVSWVTLNPGSAQLWDSAGLITYHFIKLSVDLNDEKYKLLIIDDQAYDISSYSLISGASLVFRGLEFSIGSTSVGNVHSNRVDNVVITMDEL